MIKEDLFTQDLERALLVKIASGDQLAYTKLFDRYHALVYGYSLKLTRSQFYAEEIVQEIFLKIWINRSEIIRIENFGAYLNRATRNQSYTVLRKLAAQSLLEVELNDKDLQDSSNSEHRLLYKESSEILQATIESMPPQRRTIYELCHNEGLKYNEVAAKLHISPGTVHTHMKLALKTIRARFNNPDLILILVTVKMLIGSLGAHQK
jgi:RNA polymerase sigma-70 factor (ECF subfamily)